MSLTRRTQSTPASRLVAAAVAIAGLVASLIAAAPASAITLAEVPPNPVDWAATPYSPLTWAQVPATGNAANLTFDSESGGLPDAAGVGTGFTMVQPSTGAGTSPYYLPENLSVSGGKLNIATTPGIAFVGTNTQDNSLGTGIAAANKAIYLTTTLTSVQAASGSAQGGIWFGPDDKNFVKLALVANSGPGRQIQLAREIADVTTGPAAPAVGATASNNDQVIYGTTHTALTPGPVTLGLLVDGVNKRAVATYQIGTAAPVALGGPITLPANFFDGTLVVNRPADGTVTSFGGLYTTKRIAPATTPISFAFENFGMAEVDVTPPAPPTALTATGAASAVNLAWAAPADADVVGYRVYRSATTSVALTGTPLSGAALITGTTFSDLQTFGGTGYHYAVVAVDALGNVSASATTGPTASAPTAGDVVGRYDFTTAAGAAATGYTKDSGEPFDAVRGFGWTNPDGVPTSHTVNTRVRANAVDPRLQSIIHMQIENPLPIAPFAQWKLNVPNGTYTIVAAAGDTNIGANGYDSTHTINAEGVKVLDGFQANVAREFDEATLTGVVVSDGVLNIDATGGRNTKLAYLEVYRTALVTPAVPTGVTATIDGSDIALTWTASANAESYKVFRSTTPTVGTTGTPLATVDEPTFTDETSVKGTTYYYSVVATSDQDIDSAASAPLAVELAFITPAVPTSLAFTLAGTDVSLTWAAAENAVSYDVYRGTSAEVDITGDPIGSVSVPAFSDLTADEDSTYFYVVTATSVDDRASAASAPLEVAVPEIDDPAPPVTCETGWKAELFDGTALSGTPVATVCVSAIDQNFDDGQIPAGLDDPNEYSVRWTRTIDEGAGSYEISTRTDDGVRVRIDGQLVVNRWISQAADTTYVQQVPLAAGPHTVVVEYYQGFGDASARVTVRKALTTCASGQWLAEYFDNTGLTGPVAFRECVDEIDQEFDANEGPDDIGPNLYSIRWSRTIDEGRGTYLFSARTDDGVRVSVDGERIIDEWYDQAATETHEAEVTLSAGAHLVVVDYYQGYNTASAEVGYEKTFTDTVAPDAPTGVITTSTDDAITVSWNASVATDTLGYQVYRGTTPDVATTGAPLNGFSLVAGRTFEDTTAAAETQYYYVVVAADDLGNRSTPSAPAPGLISLVPDTEAPEAPTALAAASGDANVALNWTAPASTDVAGYRVYRGTEPAVATTGIPVSGGTLVGGTSFTDSSVTNGTTYFYVAVAVDLAGNASVASNEVVAVPRVPNTTNVRVDFTATNATPVSGYFADWGQAYGPRAGATQGGGALSYGWVTQDGLQLSLVGNGRERTRVGVPPLLNSMIHMQYGDVDGGNGTNGVKTEGIWELAVPNGLYSVKVAAGDQMGATTYDSTHVVNVEGTVGIERFIGTPAAEFATVTTTVGVWDGKLTIDAEDGFNTKLGYVEVVGLPFTSHVDTVLPENRVTGHDVNAGVSATIKLPYAGIGLDPDTLPGNVKLFEVATGAEVPSTVGSSGGNDVISLAPNDPMKPLTAYRFVVGSGVKDNLGGSFAPFTSLFTTGTGEITESDEFTPVTGVAFEKIELPTGRGKYWASFAFGPDGLLYGTTIGQGIWRFPVNADGTLGVAENLGYEGVAHIGLLFDKTSTASDLRVWVTRTTANFSEQGQWVSSIHQLSGPNLATDRTIFEGLPRSLSDHLTNSMAYGPDGRIYVQQGSNQASGDLDSAWGQRGEQLLTAATLVFDPANPQVATAAAGGTDINVQTAGTQEAGETAYDPYAPTAPLKLYATGIRNAYDMVWHSNNHLYIATNGTAGGANTPGVTANANGTFTRTAAPGIPGFSTVNGRDVTQQCVRRGYTGGTVPPTGNIPTQKDLLFDVVQGGYYGHPNPERCEWVLNAGNNPATPNAVGTAQSRYPLGTLADPNYRGVAYDFEFNKSPNGAIEYKSSAFGGQLKGRLVITRFSNNNDLQFTQVDQATGRVLGAQFSVGITGVPNSTIGGVDGFNDPLEVIEDTRNGNLYVNQYDRSGGDQRMFLLRVPASQQASGITSSADELVFSGVRGTTSGVKTITVTNNGQSAATVNTALTGNQAAEFSVTGGNVSVPAGGTATLSVRFQPNSAVNAVGQRSTTLRLTSGSSTVDVGLYGLSMLGIEGNNEPTLTNVLGTLGYNLNVGWTNLAGGVQPVAKGDEVLEPLFVKSGTALPTMVPLAQYAPRENLPFGWYTGDGATADRRALGSIDISGYQSLLPPSSPGTSPTFDPGAASFGFFYVSNVFSRVGYTEDRLNTGTPHRARIYPAKNRSGSILPNSYIVGFEDADNGDYQDYLFLVTGVKPVTDTGSVDGGVRVDFTSQAGDLAAGYLRDYGQAYALRTDADQGSGLRFGWKDETTEVDLDLSTGGTPAPGLGNGRDRGTTQPDVRLDSFMHMRAGDLTGFNGTPINGYWEIALPDGEYSVTVAVGDPAPQNQVEAHTINIEQTSAITRFTPTGLAGAATRHQTATRTVTVTDGALTIDAIGGTNTKISYVDILPVTAGEGDDPTDGAQVKIAFQPVEAPTPAGWTADIGAAFSPAAGSGWVTDAGVPVDRTGITRYRTAATPGIAYPSSVLLRSYAFLQTPTPALWEYVVPNGTYEVAVSAGDSAFLDSVHTITAEGQPVIAAFTPTGATPFQTGKRTVTVTDGRLTVAGTGTNTKINWVSIKGDGLGGPIPTTPTVRVDFQPAGVTPPAGWTADTGAAYSTTTGFGWLVNGLPTDRSNATRNRTAPTAGIAYPTGDITRQTFNIAQSGTATGVTDGVWEYAIANGVYTVSVSVGDSAFLDSVHGVAVEGTSVVNNYVPTGTAPFSTGTAQVTVTDGKLTLTPTGSNTKVDWISIAGASLAAPSVSVTANGRVVGTEYDGAPATITVDATAAVGATIASLTYSLGGTAPVPYTAPFTVNQFGERTLTITATDSAGRITTRVIELTIEDIGGTVALRNEQVTRVNGAPVPGFSEDWLVMQRINSGTTAHETADEATVTISNTGAKPLRISSLAITGPNAAQFALVTPPATPSTVAPGASIPVTVRFVATSGARGIRSAQLEVVSSDPAAAVTTVQLRGGFMTAPEGNSELTLPEISALYGWTTDIGDLENGDEMRTSPLNGEEVRSLLWKRMDASLPVTARQIAAFHGCCTQTEAISINGATARHAAEYGQSIYPPTAAGQPTQVSTNPTGNFGLIVSGQTTNNTAYMAVKTWPVRDRDGRIVPGSWVLGHDYIASPNQCGIAPTNCDFQDNAYLVTNVLPVASTDTVVPAAPGAATAAVVDQSVRVTWTASAASDLAGYYVERAASATGPWTRISAGTPTSALTFVDASLPFGAQSAVYRVLAADGSGNLSAPSVTAPVDISAIASQTLRINAGGPAVTVNGLTWSADTFFTGGKTYSNPQVTQIAGTTDDAIYLTERSGTGTFGYDIPVPNGSYTVKLHFAEIYHGATGGGAGGTGKRVFSVNLEGGATEIVNLDLNARVAPMTAVVTTNTVSVTGGNLDIDLSTSVNEASIAAIEITRNVGAPVAPDAPSAVTAAVSGAGVGVSWTASPSADVTGYTVERAASAAGPWTALSGAGGVVGTTFTDTAVPFSSAAFYRVTAVAAGSGLSSDAATSAGVDVSGLFVPRALTNTVTATTVELGWTAPLGAGVTGYRIERAATAAGPWTVLSGATAVTATAFTDSTPPFANSAVYRVFAIYGGPASSPSAVSTADISGIFRAIRVNSGGPAVTIAGDVWSADTGFTGGKVYTNPGVAGIAGTTSDALYLSERSATTGPGSFSYDFSVPNGAYTVRLHFAEIFHGATGGGTGGVGARVFSANLEGGPIEVANLDLNARVAPMTAFVTHNLVTVADGNLDIDFTSTVDQPTVSAIEILRGSVAAPVAPAAPTAPQTAVTGTSVALNWTASASSDVTGYVVERAASDTGPWTRISGGTPIPATTFTDSGRTPGTTVYYRVSAVGLTGLTSVASAAASAVIAPVFVAPAAPANLQAAVVGASVNLSWTPSTSTGVTGYVVQRADTSAGPWASLTGTTPVAGTTYSDTTVAVGSTFSYRVIAIGQGGLQSVPSNVVAATRPLPAQPTIRINSGGPAVTAGGVAWAADTGFVGGKAYTNAAVTQIGGTTSDAIYLTERSATTNLGAFAYDIPVANGQYTVKLHFAEIYHGAPGGGTGGTGQRVFSVNLEGGTTEIVGLDLNSKVAPATAWVTSNLVTVNGGILDIDFSATVDQPKVAAIEVIPGVAPAPATPAAPVGVTATAVGAANLIGWTANGSAGYVVERSATSTGPWTRLTAVPVAGASFSDTGAPQSGTTQYRVIAVSSEGVSSVPSALAAVTRSNLPTIRINTGGPAVNAGGVNWIADAYFSGGKAYQNPSVTQIAGTSADAIYLNERSSLTGPGAYSYDIPVPNGSYTVLLHFAEIYWGATGGGAGGTGKRVFNVNLEGGPTEVAALDINARVAPMTALVLSNTVTVVGGNLDIDLASTIDQPSLAAIEIVPAPAPAAVVPPAVAPSAAAPSAASPQAAATPDAGASPLAAPAPAAVAPPALGTGGGSAAAPAPAASARIALPTAALVQALTLPGAPPASGAAGSTTVRQLPLDSSALDSSAADSSALDSALDSSVLESAAAPEGDAALRSAQATAVAADDLNLALMVLALGLLLLAVGATRSRRVLGTLGRRPALHVAPVAD